ncbi:baseplate J/gp47 family protein [Pseudoalteromonas sp. SG45-5]|uniref:baseplate J/gp47 family protein n=1 Tax=unclassified Pseudoalteromonas TaxID=194690 RepID=UPI0015F9BC6D|nr:MULTISPECIES: baseplate J/gp47 family protein [unclassified Pseudoalteromonas]MBB1384362.1 baseplate J/gp47 family protein [Pseudoalteromonas sp. SG45-5]MBB1392350.1 baseplate J/gp47 family protein [Pseudoalteromonas sp. SG44-4]MBB1446825.1 baseplate J/gp47 family protein [Pseudoalteromonas sp. SG41-6]
MDYTHIFKQELTNAGIPVTNDELRALWQKHVDQGEFTVSNTSTFSPFFRLQKSIMVEPAEQLINSLITHVMPNSFVMLAGGEWLKQHGESRKTPKLPAVKAQGVVEFTRTDIDTELVIPSGTVVESLPINGQVYRVFTLYDQVFAMDEATHNVPVQAEQTGQSYNLAAGYYVRVISDIENLTATNNTDWLTTAGQDIETDDNYRLRIRDAFSSLGSYHVDAVYRSIISAFTGISVDNIVFEKNAPRGPGSANAYVFLNVGDISPALLNQINNYIAAGNHGSGDDLQVFAINKQPFDIAANYQQHPNTQNRSADIEQFIRAAFRQNAAYKSVTKCAPNELFSFSQLATELHTQFSELKTIRFENDDINCELWLPAISSMVLNNE